MPEIIESMSKQRREINKVVNICLGVVKNFNAFAL